MQVSIMYATELPARRIVSPAMLHLTLVGFAVVIICALAISFDFWRRYGSRFDGVDLAKSMRGRVVLSFDDGPASSVSGWSDSPDDALAFRGLITSIDPEWEFSLSPTENLARVLSIFDARAVFFLRGDVLANDPAATRVARILVTAGHVIGNHSFSHVRADRMNPDACIDNLSHADVTIFHTCGVRPDLFRPPYGNWHVRRSIQMWRRPELAHYGLPVGWTHSTRDWEKKLSEVSRESLENDVNILLRQLEASNEGTILLQHDVWIYAVLFTTLLLERIKASSQVALADPDILRGYLLMKRSGSTYRALWSYYARARVGATIRRLYAARIWR